MQRTLLACALAAAIALRPAEARAGGLDDLFRALLIIAVVGAATVGVTEVLTATATYQNYRAASRNEEPSAGWVGVGVVGGLFNVGLGGYLFLDGLPDQYEVTCDEGEKMGGRPCIKKIPARSGSLIAGSLLFGFGAFSLGASIAAARSGPGDAGGRAPSPGAAPAVVGLSLPLLRF